MRLMAGVHVPDSPLITEALEYAHKVYEPYLFNHSVRSWLFAETIVRIKGIDYDREVVAIGTLLHDVGLTASVSGPNRFEVNPRVAFCSSAAEAPGMSPVAVPSLRKKT
jgi:HD superfamily phosphodiesterase